MLKQLIAHNFQIHKDVDIHFHPGVNVITGASEAGKSSIIRMIRWVTLNRPSGRSIVKKGESDTKVKLIFDNGVIRKRRKKETTTYNVDGTVLKAIGKELPKEVTDVSLIEDKNCQQQHNPYFLLVKSPGEVAKELNELAGISVIDKLFTIINSELRKTKADLISTKETIPELKEKLEKLEYVEELDEKIAKFAKLIKKNKQRSNMLTNIEDAIADLEAIDNEEKENAKQLQHGETIKLLNVKVEEYRKKQKSYAAITSAISDLEDAEFALKEANEKLEILAKQKRKAMRNVEECPLCGTIIGKEY